MKGVEKKYTNKTKPKTNNNNNKKLAKMLLLLHNAFGGEGGRGVGFVSDPYE